MAKKSTENQKPLVYLYTGEGGGKTTNAFGFALRSIGHGYKTIIIQFMKGQEDIGEVKACKRLVQDLGCAGFLRHCVSEQPDVRSIAIAREVLAYHAGLADFSFVMHTVRKGLNGEVSARLIVPLSRAPIGGELLIGVGWLLGANLDRLQEWLTDYTLVGWIVVAVVVVAASGGDW